jgi:4-hydroxy-tetrahydrodipicolinate reductase
MKKLAIIGASGRMGAELLALSPEFKFVATQGVGRSKLAVDGLTLSDHVSKLDPSKIDAVIDFSLPELTDDVIEWCVKNQKPLVSGVTGISLEQKNRFAEAGRSVAVLWAPNMSLGIAVLSRMISELRNLKGFEFQIEEVHHKRKKDKPSGTALFLQEKLETAVGEDVPAPVAIRGGGVFGIHRVWAMGEEETITLEHNAMNRRVFARGALRAAQWLIKKKPGRYTLDDVIAET